jgi:8-oxo-dGTP pyrophosphatase MutT (NUDIX family)
MKFEEPPFEAKGTEPAAGAVVVEPDGRLWLVSPTNGFGHYKTTFPKGKCHGMTLKATALKEVFEEAGLEVELFDLLLDVTKTSSRTRYYLARRKGGNPADMCWETQAVHLVPLEHAKEMLNQKVDHSVIDKLLDRWGEWAGWFFKPDHDDPARKAARSGRIPATRADWLHLPLPLKRVRITLDLHLGQQEARNLAVGFVPWMMEQKWFAYYENGTLYEHRSWTGFCISQVHFVPDGKGLRATFAEVNREPRQYANTDDDEDRVAIETRIRELANMTPEDRKAEDPFVAGLKATVEPNYLGNPDVVGGLLEPYFQGVLDHHVAMSVGKDTKAAYEAYMQQNTALAHVFSGDDPTYRTIGTWNTASSLGALSIQVLDLDPVYYANESLFCILSEGLAGVALCLREMAVAFEADPKGEFERDLRPRITELMHFTATVLMGTQSVMFPERTLKDFRYVPVGPAPEKPGLFDIDPPASRSTKDDEPLDLNELRRVFGLPPSTDDDGDEETQTSANKPGRPITIPGPLGALAKKVGGIGLLAEELGVSTRTVRRWATGGKIPPLPLKMIGILFEKHQVDSNGPTLDGIQE